MLKIMKMNRFANQALKSLSKKLRKIETLVLFIKKKPKFQFDILEVCNFFFEIAVNI